MKKKTSFARFWKQYYQPKKRIKNKYPQYILKTFFQIPLIRREKTNAEEHGA